MAGLPFRQAWCIAINHSAVEILEVTIIMIGIGIGINLCTPFMLWPLDGSMKVYFVSCNAQ